MYGSTPTGVDRDTKASNAPQSPSPAPKQPQGLPSSNNANLPVRRAVAPNNGVGRRGGPTGPGGAAIKRSVSIVPPPSAFNVAATSAAPAAAGGAAPYGSLPTGRDGTKANVFFFFFFVLFSFSSFSCVFFV
jgi:hypothetical protein